MDESIFERIKTGIRREKRSLAGSLYGSLKGILTGEGYRNPFWEKEFVSQSQDAQVQYLNRAIEAIASVPGYENHARNIASLVENYHPLHHLHIEPEMQARKFSGTIREWEEFTDKDGIYRDWEAQLESGETDLSWGDFARENYRTIDAAFLTSDSDPNDIIGGFNLPEGMSKLPDGTPVEIIALGFVRQDGSFSASDLYGVKLLNGSAEQVGATDGIYFDVMRDNPGVLQFMVESQRELGRARQLLYEK